MMGSVWLGLLAREWSGSAVGLALVAIGVGIGDWGLLLALAGTALLIGNVVHLIRLAASRRKFPAPGRRVDIGGFHVHLVAEGKAVEALPLVMFGGSHAAGAVMAHLHDVLKATTRSILIDRPGTGWSDTGPFPRTTAREADEMVRALDAAGEPGKFVLAGYSFGGLLAANIARRHPERVARLVLLDPTPLETIVFGPRFASSRAMVRDGLTGALKRLVGIHPPATPPPAPAGHEASASAFEAALGESVTTMRRVEVSAGAALAAGSIYRELLPEGAARAGWETVVYDGDLGALETWLVAPGDALEVKAFAEVGGAGKESARMVNFFARSRERYLAASSNSRRIVAPPGSTHQFVYTHPQFVIDVLRRAVTEPLN